MLEVNEKNNYFEKINFPESCQGYCIHGEKNKACGRIDKVCNNLGNCSGEFKDYYKRKKAIYDITSEIDRENEAILDIY